MSRRALRPHDPPANPGAAPEPPAAQERPTPMPATPSSPVRDLVDELLEHATRAAPTPTIPLAHGRRAAGAATAGAPVDVLEIHGPSGEIELSITITAEGPSLRVRGARLELAATRSITMRCDVFEVAAQREVAITAARGDLTLEAGDDVVVVGERIRLN